MAVDPAERPTDQAQAPQVCLTTLWSCLYCNLWKLLCICTPVLFLLPYCTSVLKTEAYHLPILISVIFYYCIVLTYSNFLFLQHSKCKEAALFGSNTHTHLGRWWKQWASPCPPARTALRSGPHNATSTPSQHLSTARRGLQTPWRSFQTL